MTWNLSMWLTELAVLGRQAWWWQLRKGLSEEFRDLNPNKMVLKMRGKQNVGSLAFGETPSLSVLKILQTVQLAPGSRVVDLGSGRGMPCLTAAAQGYPSLGLEYFAVYTERSTRVAQRYGWPAQFLSGNFLSRPLPPAQLYLVSATAFPEELRQDLARHLEDAPDGSWIVTQDWVLPPPFVLTRLQQLPVSWGIAKYCYHLLSKAAPVLE